MVRTKLVAVLLGPSGVGLVSLYVSIMGLVSTIAQLGIDQSGVREVAEADGCRDPMRVARVATTLRRFCWFTGVLGWLLTAALAWPVSQWTFGSSERKWAVAILGVTVLMGAITGGQSALLQGLRQIGHLARIQVFSAIFNTIFAIGLYSWLGEQGIVPVIIITAATQLGLSWFYSKRLVGANTDQSFAEFILHAKQLLKLGVAFMYTALIAAMAGVFVRSLINRELGLEQSGVYQAAWGISGLFAGFILGAMATDFYPRLTQAATDDQQMGILVNEQIDIGILLALPGLIFTILFAPWIIELLYSDKFVQGENLLPWFVIGVFTQVVGWPMGIIQRAMGKWKWLIASHTFLHVMNVALALILVRTIKLEGVALAFTLSSAAHGFVQLQMARKLASFKLRKPTMILVVHSTLILGASVAICSFDVAPFRIVLTLLLVIGGILYSIIGLINRLECDHRLVVIIQKLPLAGKLLEKFMLKSL